MRRACTWVLGMLLTVNTSHLALALLSAERARYCGSRQASPSGGKQDAVTRGVMRLHAVLTAYLTALWAVTLALATLGAPLLLLSAAWVHLLPAVRPLRVLALACSALAATGGLRVLLLGQPRRTVLLMAGATAAGLAVMAALVLWLPPAPPALAWFFGLPALLNTAWALDEAVLLWHTRGEGTGEGSADGAGAGPLWHAAAGTAAFVAAPWVAAASSAVKTLQTHALAAVAPTALMCAALLAADWLPGGRVWTAGLLPWATAAARTLSGWLLVQL